MSPPPDLGDLVLLSSHCGQGSFFRPLSPQPAPVVAFLLVFPFSGDPSTAGSCRSPLAFLLSSSSRPLSNRSLYSFAFVLDPRAKLRGLQNVLKLLAQCNNMSYIAYFAEVKAELHKLYDKYESSWCI
jgi:hypothetical protein